MDLSHKRSNQLVKQRTMSNTIIFQKIRLSCHTLVSVGKTQSLKGKIVKEKKLLLLRKYEEEMLDAYLTEDAYFPELLRYSNIMFEFCLSSYITYMTSLPTKLHAN